MTVTLTRRELLAWAALLPGCGLSPRASAPDARLPEQVPSREPEAPSEYADATDALFDVMLPAEPGSPGAREAGVDRVLEQEQLVRFAVSQGFLRPLPEALLVALDDLGTLGRATVNRALDARAQLERPLSRFRDLPRADQERIAQAAFDDDATAPLMQAMRAACFLAWLGAFTSEGGLRDVGFPAFEDFADGRAVSGWPRTRDGRRVDATVEDLHALEARGELDDYTVNRAPSPTPGDDLTLVLTPQGDLR